MTIQTIRRCLQTFLDGIRRLQETLSSSVTLTAAPTLGAIPSYDWRDYDVLTFKRRRIRLSIAQETVSH